MEEQEAETRTAVSSAPNNSPAEGAARWPTRAAEDRNASPYLDDRVAARRSLDGPAAAFRLVVRAVVGLGLHLDPQLVGAGLVGERPLERREGGGHWDAGRKSRQKRSGAPEPRPLALHSKPERPLPLPANRPAGTR